MESREGHHFGTNPYWGCLRLSNLTLQHLDMGEVRKLGHRVFWIGECGEHDDCYEVEAIPSYLDAQIPWLVST